MFNSLFSMNPNRKPEVGSFMWRSATITSSTGSHPGYFHQIRYLCHKKETKAHSFPRWPRPRGRGQPRIRSCVPSSVDYGWKANDNLGPVFLWMTLLCLASLKKMPYPAVADCLKEALKFKQELPTVRSKEAGSL